MKARERGLADENEKPGRIIELFQGRNLRNTLVGVSLASIGLVTFWGGHIYGKNALLREAQKEALVAESVAPVAPKDGSEAEKKAYKSSRQAALKKHAAHHSAKHMAMMRKQMRQGSTFSAAHARAQRLVGK